MSLVNDKIEAQRKHFNSISKKYAAGREENNHKWVKCAIWNRCIKAIKEYLPEDFSMLEPMCGYAEGYDLITQHHKQPIKYIGFDYSDEIVANLHETRSELRICYADVTQYTPAEDAYDLIVLIGGLHHVPDHAEEVVKNLSVGLKKGGVFINFEPTHNNFVYKKIREWVYQRNEIFDHNTEHDFSTEELSGMFADAGLKNLYWHNAGLLSYILFYNPYAFPWLNFGGVRLAKSLYKLDEVIADKAIGKTLSFATMSAWMKAN